MPREALHAPQPEEEPHETPETAPNATSESLEIKTQPRLGEFIDDLHKKLAEEKLSSSAVERRVLKIGETEKILAENGPEAACAFVDESDVFSKRDKVFIKELIMREPAPPEPQPEATPGETPKTKEVSHIPLDQKVEDLITKIPNESGMIHEALRSVKDAMGTPDGEDALINFQRMYGKRIQDAGKKDPSVLEAYDQLLALFKSVPSPQKPRAQETETKKDAEKPHAAARQEPLPQMPKTSPAPSTPPPEKQPPQGPQSAPPPQQPAGQKEQKQEPPEDPFEAEFQKLKDTMPADRLPWLKNLFDVIKKGAESDTSPVATMKRIRANVSQKNIADALVRAVQEKDRGGARQLADAMGGAPPEAPPNEPPPPTGPPPPESPAGPPPPSEGKKEEPKKEESKKSGPLGAIGSFFMIFGGLAAALAVLGFTATTKLIKELAGIKDKKD